MVFHSSSTNLVNVDSNDGNDIFVHDRQLGTTALVSVSTTGVQADSSSTRASVSDDGRYVAFSSYAFNLDPSPGDAWQDIFVRDRVAGVTTLVSASSGAPATSSNGHCDNGLISGDGQHVAFSCFGDNLVAGDTNAAADVFIRSLATGVTQRVNIDSSGGQTQGDTSEAQWVGLSQDGQRVAFHSAASDLVAGDTNGQRDVFVHQRATGTTVRISVSAAGTEADGASAFPTINSTGQYVAFESAATNLVADDQNGFNDAFVHDFQTGNTARVGASASAEPDERSIPRGMSGDGAILAVDTLASNLVSGSTPGQFDVLAAPNPLTCGPGSPVPLSDLTVTAIVRDAQGYTGTVCNAGPDATGSFVVELLGLDVESVPRQESVLTLEAGACLDVLFAGCVGVGDGSCTDAVDVQSRADFLDEVVETDENNNAFVMSFLEEMETVHPWRDNATGNERTKIGWNYAMGYHFTPQRDGLIHALGGFFDGTKTVRLFDKGTGALLAEVSVAAANDWTYTSVAQPVPVAAGTTYTVAVYLAGSGASYRYGITRFPQTYGDVRIEASTYASTGSVADARPTNSIPYAMYGQADFAFVATGGPPPAPVGLADYNATLGAPTCSTVGSRCDSGTLIDGRGDNGPESHASNTLDSCLDGNGGAYHADESLDRIVLSSIDSAPLASGNEVHVEATVWVWSTGSSDYFDLYHAADAQDPTWQLITTLQASQGGLQTLATDFVLPLGGALQAVRGQWRYGGSGASACVSGIYNDRDDLVFAAQ